MKFNAIHLSTFERKPIVFAFTSYHSTAQKFDDEILQ